jgi:AcrR family transcriptional regulator
MSSANSTGGSARVVTDVATKPRKRLPRAEREERMLDAAEAVFGRRGFQGASMDEIARRAGITKALVYQYFGSKEGLCEATVDRGVARLFAALEEATAAVPAGPAQVAAFVQGYFDHIEANRGSLWLLYAEASSASALNAMRARNAELVADLISRAFDELGREADADWLAVSAQSMVGAGEQVARWWTSHPDISKDVVVARFTELANAIITAGFFEAPRRG